jgi:hypothetical protein
MSTRFTENNINNSNGICRLNEITSKINSNNISLTTNDTYFNNNKIFNISNLTSNDILNFQNNQLQNTSSINVQQMNNISSTINFYIISSLTISTSNVNSNLYSEIFVYDKFTDTSVTNFNITLNNDSNFLGMSIKIKKSNPNNKFYLLSGKIGNTTTFTKIENSILTSTNFPITNQDCYHLISNGIDWFII